MLTIDDKDVRRYANHLLAFKDKAFPYATKATINKAAFETRRKYQARMADELTLRNKWTASSVRVVQARGLIVSKQEAVIGSLADYMATQEFGGVVTPERGQHQPIATSYAAGQGVGTRPRTRLPTKPNKRSNIRLKRRGSTVAGRKARNRAAVQEAAQSGSKYVYLDLGRRKGLFRVLGGKRKPYVRMVWDLTRRSVRVRPKPLLGPATDKIQQQIPQYYSDALLYQLKRHRILQYGR